MHESDSPICVCGDLSFLSNRNKLHFLNNTNNSSNKKKPDSCMHLHTFTMLSPRHQIIQSHNYRMVWSKRNLRDDLVPTPLLWPGTHSTRWGCSELYPTWPWMLSDRVHPQLLWAACSRASSLPIKNFFLIINLNLPSLCLRPFYLVLSLHILKGPPPTFL